MPVLEEMAHASIPPIIVVTVTSQQPMHDLSDGVCLSFDQQMKVVGHQAVGIEEERQPGLLTRQEGKKLLVVRGRIKYPAAIIATREHVIKTALDFSATLASHERRILVRYESRVNKTFTASMLHQRDDDSSEKCS